MTTIRLYGEMGRRFGRVHHAHLDTNTPAEAVRYLCSQFPKARAYLMGAKDRGKAFAVFRGKENLTREQLAEPAGADDIRIAPVIIGAKSGGLFNMILGAVLIVAGVYFQNPYLVSTGVAMVAGGVVQLLTPMPKAPKGRDSPDNSASYVFNGAVNTQAQGNPVPLLYGRMIVGSAVISAGINAETYTAQTPGVGPGYTPPGGGHWNPKTPYEIRPL